MTRQVNQTTLDHIKRCEGVRLSAYLDSAGIPTIGVGHTGPEVKLGNRITQEECDALLHADLQWAQAAVESSVTQRLTDNQFGALVSVAFNIGAQAFRNSSLVRTLNRGDYHGVPSQMALWVKATVDGKKVTVPGLVNRRTADIALWLTPDFSNVTAGVESTAPKL